MEKDSQLISAAKSLKRSYTVPMEKDEHLFTTARLPELVELFQKTQCEYGEGLDIDAFRGVLNVVLTEDNADEYIALFHKIDTNCDQTVDLNEFLAFLIFRFDVSKGFRYDAIFPKPIKVIPLNHRKNVVGVKFIPNKEMEDGCKSAFQEGPTRTYQRGLYISVSSDGIFTDLSIRAENPIQNQISLSKTKNIIPFSHDTKKGIIGMAYIEELRQVVIATTQREVLFYNFQERTSFHIGYALIVEDSQISALNYGSNGTKGVLSIGDVKGFVYVLISETVGAGMFNDTVYEEMSLRDYPTAYVSTLLKSNNEEFHCFKMPIFNDICTQIQYIPSIESLVICSNSSKTMVIVDTTKKNGAEFPEKNGGELHEKNGAELHEKSGAEFPKTVFNSPVNEAFFTCVEYSRLTGLLLTGGKDGLLRQWDPRENMLFRQSFVGHVKPITHMSLNYKDKVLVTLSEDKNVRVWSEEQMLPLQSFQVAGLEEGPITSMCYNTDNNELVLANSKIGAYIGRGTDVFHDSCTSHLKPLCCALYHTLYKQVVSVCQDGMVTVWDISTGKAKAQFKVTPEKHVGHTAIAFDEPQRRLITASQDGKLRFWNFNSGVLLDVIPVTMPKEVIGIVCFKDRLFVTGRNSNIIYEIDTVRHEYRFWKHCFLSDISSMDVYKNLLCTAASNGNIVIWNADFGSVLSWFNGSNGPQTFHTCQGEQGLIGSQSDEKDPKKSQTRNKTVVKAPVLVKCLKKRENKADTAMLLTSSDGYIWAWSVALEGGLIGKFRAVDEEGAIITTMSTDVEEHVLLTGDSTGKICQWDIKRFGLRRLATEGPFEDTKGWRVSLARPPLLGSWQCHRTEVVSVLCDHSCQRLITAGLDCYLHLWENTGSHIGSFGADTWSKAQLGLMTNAEEQPAKVDVIFGRKNEEEKSPWPTTPEETFDTLFQEREPISEHIPLPPICGKAQLTQNQAQLKPQPPQTPLISGGAHLKQSSLQTLNDTRSKYGHVLKIRQGATFKDSVLTPCPPNTLPGKQEREPISEQIPLPPICGKAQLTQNQAQLKPQPPQTPLISGGAHLKQSSLQTLNDTRSKYGRVLKIRQGATFKDTVLTPCPPNTLPRKQERKPISEQIPLPPICGKAQLTQNQAQLKPQPPQTPLISGGAHLKQSSLQTLNGTWSKYGLVPKIRQGATFKDSILTPCPPNTLPGKQERKPISEQIPLPPICGKAMLTQNQAQLKPQPPQTLLIGGGAHLKKSSLQTLNDTRSEYGRVPKIRQGATFKDSVLTPCPPNTLPRKQEKEPISEQIPLPPICIKAMLIQNQTQLKPQPPQTPLIRGGAHLKQSSLQTLNDTRSEYGRVPKIRQGDTHTHTQLKPNPPWR